MRRTLAFLILIVSASGLALAQGSGSTQPASPPAQSSAPAGDAKKGKETFVSYGCYQCHNYSGQGGGAGPRLAPNPLPFEGFRAYVRRPRTQMPPYTAKVVTDQELADIYAFLKTMTPPPDVKTIPLLNQ